MRNKSETRRRPSGLAALALAFAFTVTNTAAAVTLPSSFTLRTSSPGTFSMEKVTVTGPGTLSFSVSTSGFGGTDSMGLPKDHFQFYIDGKGGNTTGAYLTGNRYESYSYQLPAGSHKLEWSLYKSPRGSGSSSAYVSGVRWTGGGTTPPPSGHDDDDDWDNEVYIDFDYEEDLSVGVPVLFNVWAETDNGNAVKLSVKGLPPGLKLDAKTGTVSGIPTKAGYYTVVLTGTDAKNAKIKTVEEYDIWVEALPVGAVGTFSGYAARENGLENVSGTFSLTATAAGKLTAKVVTSAGTLSFSAKSWGGISGDGFYWATFTGTKGLLYVEVHADGALYGALSLSAWGWDFGWVAARRAMPVPAGYYTVALPVLEVLDEGYALNAPYGDGYLTLTVNAKGAVKLAGALADGTKVSGSSTVMAGGDAHCVPVWVKVHGGKGYFGGLLWIYGGGIVLGDEAFAWKYPGKTPGKYDADRFSVALGALGCQYRAADVPLYNGLSFSASEPQLFDADWFWMPDGVPVTATATALSLPAARKPAYSKTEGGYVFDETRGNPTVATLSVTKNTGVIKGKFNVYAFDESGAFATIPVSYTGVLLPAFIGEENGAARGSWLMPWKDGKTQLKQSFGVRIGGGGSSSGTR